jgi:hypothetical protein
MPCMSYDDDPQANAREWKKKTDMLARIACKAMAELTEQGKADFLLLRDDEVRVWWEAHQEADRQAREAREKKERENRIRQEALAKLTPEEKKILGIKR